MLLSLQVANRQQCPAAEGPGCTIFITIKSAIMKTIKLLLLAAVFAAGFSSCMVEERGGYYHHPHHYHHGGGYYHRY